MFAHILAIALTLRCALDIALPDDKQIWLTGAYLASVMTIILLSIGISGLALSDAVVIVALSVLMTLNLLWIPAELGPQLYFTLTIAIPIVFLLAVSACPPLLFQELRRRFAWYGIPAIFVFSLWFIFHQPATTDLASYFNEHPHHVVAQTIAKVALIGVNEGMVLSGFALLVLTLLNVRSALIGYALALTAARFKMLHTWKVAVALMLLVVICIGIAVAEPSFVDDLIQRMIYRKSGEFDEYDIWTASSGRTEIWTHYIDMLMDSNTLELLFGRGAVWLYGGGALGHLEGHNDALNLLICYGVFGTLIICYAWYLVLSRVDNRYRTPCIILFAVLFMTNGVLFHQSNVLFLLFMGGQRQSQAVTRPLFNSSSFETAASPHLDGIYRD